MKTTPPPETFTARVAPYFMMGLMIVLFIVGIFIFSYILIIAAVIGLILFLFASIRDKFFGHKKHNARTRGKYEGRVIDQDEIEYQAHVSTHEDDKNNVK